MVLVVVVVLDPFVCQLIELLQGVKLGMQREKAIPEAPKETLDLAFGRPVAHRCMGEADVKTKAGLMNLLGAVVTAVVKVQAFGFATFVQSGSERCDHVGRVVAIEELGVGNEP